MEYPVNLFVKLLSVVLLFVLCFGVNGCKQEEITESGSVPLNIAAADPLTDSEGNVYQTIQIGNQIWMTENLKATLASDGTVLQDVWVYDNNDNNVAEYGRLYTLDSAQNACPAGWHLPTYADWQTLISAVGSDPGTKLKLGGSTGFNARLGGRGGNNSFGFMGDLGLYWTSTLGNPDHAFQIIFISNESGIETEDQAPVTDGKSVRYIKD